VNGEWSENKRTYIHKRKYIMLRVKMRALEGCDGDLNDEGGVK